MGQNQARPGAYPAYGPCGQQQWVNISIPIPVQQCQIPGLIWMKQFVLNTGLVLKTVTLKFYFNNGASSEQQKNAGSKRMRSMIVNFQKILFLHQVCLEN